MYWPLETGGIIVSGIQIVPLKEMAPLKETHKVCM